jgi:hypothetical protein
MPWASYGWFKPRPWKVFGVNTTFLAMFLHIPAFVNPVFVTGYKAVLLKEARDKTLSLTKMRELLRTVHKQNFGENTTNENQGFIASYGNRNIATTTITTKITAKTVIVETSLKGDATNVFDGGIKLQIVKWIILTVLKVNATIAKFRDIANRNVERKREK